MPAPSVEYRTAIDPAPAVSLPDQLREVAGWVDGRAGAGLAGDEAARSLVWGIDTLVAAVDIDWTARTESHDEPVPELFRLLDAAKDAAKESEGGDGEPIEIDAPAAWGGFWRCNVHGYGMDGYSWVLRSKVMTWKLGSWLSPRSRPSLMVELSSEGLWRYGARELLAFVRRIIEHHGGKMRECKVSRADMCVDVLVPDGLIAAGLLDHIVSRANDTQLFHHRRKVNAIGIGGASAKLKCRIYDKPLEISQKSGKLWMYDLWGLKKVPDDHRVFRVEFQLRREALKELGVGDAETFIAETPNLWKYLTGSWLKFIDNPGEKHKDRQRVSGWWKVVRAGWIRAADAAPVVRAKPTYPERDQLTAQVLGCLTSLMTIEAVEKGQQDAPEASIAEGVRLIVEAAAAAGIDATAAAEVIREKVAKHDRQAGAFEQAKGYRGSLRKQALKLLSAPLDRSRPMLGGGDETGQRLQAEFWKRIGRGVEPEPAASEEQPAVAEEPESPPTESRPSELQAGLAFSPA